MRSNNAILYFGGVLLLIFIMVVLGRFNSIEQRVRMDDNKPHIRSLIEFKLFCETLFYSQGFIESMTWNMRCRIIGLSFIDGNGCHWIRTLGVIWFLFLHRMVFCRHASHHSLSITWHWCRWHVCDCEGKLLWLVLKFKAIVNLVNHCEWILVTWLSCKLL